MNTVNKKVMVFGVFDLLHPGHLWFLRSAREQGSELIVVVARDSIVEQLKGKRPQQSQEERIRIVNSIPEVSRVLLGDAIQGSYKVIFAHQPDVICLGYDQHMLADDLAGKMQNGMLASMLLFRLDAYQSDIFHTSLLMHQS